MKSVVSFVIVAACIQFSAFAQVCDITPSAGVRSGQGYWGEKCTSSPSSEHITQPKKYFDLINAGFTSYQATTQKYSVTGIVTYQPNSNENHFESLAFSDVQLKPNNGYKILDPEGNQGFPYKVSVWIKEDSGVGTLYADIYQDGSLLKRLPKELYQLGSSSKAVIDPVLETGK